MLIYLLAGFIALFGSSTAVAASVPQQSPSGSTRAPVVAIQPLGDVDPALIRRLADHLRSMLAAEVVVLPVRALPASAYYSPRKRYRGERILDDLEARVPARVTKIIGVMSRDLSATKREIYDWGILGIAGLSRRAAVVSIHRLARHRAQHALLERRLSQVATHELGHTFGLPHCRTPRCLMNECPRQHAHRRSIQREVLRHMPASPNAFGCFDQFPACPLIGAKSGRAAPLGRRDAGALGLFMRDDHETPDEPCRRSQRYPVGSRSSCGSQPLAALAVEAHRAMSRYPIAG